MDPDCIVDGVATLGCIPSLLQNLIQFALVFAGIIALFLIIFAGIRYITSGGDQKQLEGAKKTLTFAIGGLLLILLSFLIINIIAQITGVDSIKTFGWPTSNETLSDTCSASNPNYCSRAKPNGCCDYPPGSTCTRVTIERPPGYNYVCK